jgi:hypothetical protein
MTEITVESIGPDTYRVTIAGSGSSTVHEVTAEAADVERLAPGADPVWLVEASFRFLLEREPKESILGRFDLPVIGRYFPEYPSRIGEYL